MHNFMRIVKYTVLDVLRQKSFFIMLGVSIGFVFLLRGCYKGNYVVNGQTIDNLKVAWNASIIAFHVVSAGALLIAAVLSMNLFSRDRDDGTAQYMLSKPLHRNVYAFGRAIGVWLVSSGFMFVLHLTIFCITLFSAGGAMPGYLTASVVCFVNVLLMVLMVCLFSLFMPDFAAAFAGIGVVGVSYASDIVYQVMQSQLFQQAAGSVATQVSVWRIVWPKLSSLQSYAVSLIDNKPFQFMGPLHPFINMLLYAVLAGVLLAISFRKREV
jgi:ABC-type transport system involved in multi-copper enzyme maturation permease subunit